MIDTTSVREEPEFIPQQEGRQRPPFGDRRGKRWSIFGVGILLVGGVCVQGLLAIVALAVFDMVFLPTETQRLQDQFLVVSHAVGNLHARTGARGYKRTNDGFFIRFQDRWMRADAFGAQFPDALAQIERLNAAADICMALYPVTDQHPLCVQWRRDGRVGGLTGRASLHTPRFAQYNPIMTVPAGHNDLLLTLVWSADAALLDDWEASARLAPPPPDGRVRMETLLVSRESCTQPMRNGELPPDTYYSAAGFSFSTPCSRAGLDETAGSLPRPVVDVLVRKIAWDPDAAPTAYDDPADVHLVDETGPPAKIIRPVRVLRDPLTLATRFYTVPDALIAEFDLADFRHGRTIVLTYASGRTVRRTIALNGVQ